MSHGKDASPKVKATNEERKKKFKKVFKLSDKSVPPKSDALQITNVMGSDLLKCKTITVL